jgi:hypothetical protein
MFSKNIYSNLNPSNLFFQKKYSQQQCIKQVKITRTIISRAVLLRPISEVERAAFRPICYAAIDACRQMLIAGRRTSHVIDIKIFPRAFFLCIDAHFSGEEHS